MPYISDRELNKLRLDLEVWRDEAGASHNREEKLVVEIRSLQGKVNRLTDEIERVEVLNEAIMASKAKRV